MSKFRFIGDPRNGGDGPQTIAVFGHTFGRMDGTEVPDAVADKLRRHTHFEEVTDSEPEAEAKPRGRKAKPEAEA